MLPRMIGDMVKPKVKAKKPVGRPRRVPPVEYRWRPGQSGNPRGLIRQPDAIRQLKQLTKSELVEVGTLIVKGDVTTLKRVARDPKATVIHALVAAVAVRIIEKGDMVSLDLLLNRLIGKVRDEVALTGNMPQIIITLPSNGREVMIEEVKLVGPTPPLGEEP